MSEILQNTGVTLWSIRDDYDELQTSVFEALTGTGGKSNIRLIDEAIGNINSKLNGYYFEYSDDRLYICKKSENENIKRYPVTLNDNNGHIASKVDGSTITIDENGIVRGLPVDDALSSISTNPIQNKVVKAKVDEIESSISTLNGDGEGSVKKAVADGITKVVADAPEDFDTLKEMSDWITNHENDASAMNSAIQDNKNAIESLQTGKADKIEIPTTLPANGGNADTVNWHTVDINVPSDAKFTDTTYSDATQIEHGLMSVDDKKKLDGLKKYTPDGTTITADEDGTLHGADTIQVDGITITRDDATKVIALAKTLQDKIALVDNKIDKTNVANNLTTTEADFVLDARQGKALQDQLTTLNGSLNSKKIPSFGIENIFTGNPLCIVNNGSDVISVQTGWDIDNGGYMVKNIKYPAGTATNLTVSLSLPANSIVIVDVNTLNGENIDIQGSLIRSNFTSSPKNWILSIKFTGRTNQILTDIRYMPLVIHLG